MDADEEGKTAQNPDNDEDEHRDKVQQMHEDDSLMSHPGVPAQMLNGGEMPSDEDLETYRIVFELFDRDRSGFIDNHDLAAIAVKLNKDPSEGKWYEDFND